MNWCDERYVRLYTRDTPDFLAMSFEAQGLLALILRKLDRAGVMELGRQGKRGVAISVGHAARWDVIEPALEELLMDGCLVLDGSRLVMPNYLDAQEATQSDRMRQSESRARRREVTHNDVTKRDDESRNVTECHAPSHAVTDGHTLSQTVTPCLAVPCLAVPNQTPVSPVELVLVQSQPRWRPDFEAVYRGYPRKEGKKRGMAIAERTIRTPEDYANLKTAVENYAANRSGQDPRYTMHFDTWMGCWQDYLDAEVGKVRSPEEESQYRLALRTLEST